MRFIALLLAPALLGAQEPMSAMIDTTARPIALDEAVRLAQQNSIQAIQARGTMRTSSASVRSSFAAAFLPSISLSTGAGWSGGQGDRVDDQGRVISGGNWNYSNGLSMSLTLFDGGRSWYNLSNARASAEAAEVGELQTRFNVALTVKQQYFAVLAARDQIAAAHASFEQAEWQYRAARARVEAGSAIISDTLRAVIQMGTARLAVLQAERALHNANASLTRTVASPQIVTALPDTTMDWVDLDADSIRLQQLALDAPAVQTARANLTAAEAGAKAARAPYLPSVGMSYNRSGGGRDSQFGWGDRSYNYQSRVSFSLSYPLFDRFNRERSAISARVAADNAEATLRDAELKARADLVLYAGQLHIAQEQIRIGEMSVAAAEEDLRVQQMRYELGSSTLLDVLTSQTQLNTARTSLIAARFSYRQAKAQLEALLGRDL